MVVACVCLVYCITFIGVFSFKKEKKLEERDAS
jgi:hypothetical protein